MPYFSLKYSFSVFEMTTDGFFHTEKTRNKTVINK